MSKIPTDIAKLSFEKALADLEDIVRRLESGEAELEESIKLYERGAALKAHCEAKLKSAQEKIEKIVVGPNGEADGEAGAAPKTEPAEFD